MSRRPHPLPRLHRWRTNLLQAPLFFLATGFFGTLALLASLVAKTGRTQHRIARVWARACVRISGARLTIRGREHLGQYPVAVYAANHTSYMDTPVIFAALPFQFRILAKKELWSMPFIGWYLNRSGQIPVDTGSATLSSLGAGVKALRAGMPLFVFPEGSRTPDGDLQTFLAGAAFLAIRSQVPLVPVALTGGYDLLPIHTRHFYPGELVMTIAQPIQTHGMTIRQADELTERLRSMITEMLGDSSQPGPHSDSTRASEVGRARSEESA
jgi:1-acyl-sn-glycerol-3-phosphate acyltransferase